VIAQLRGQLAYKGFDVVIVDVSGVGYRVEVPLSTLGRLPGIGETVSLFTHTWVREDALKLYGFDHMDALRLFERLIGVSGVGPRLALAALSHLSPDNLQRAVIQGDVGRLTQISGIGKKTAERIVVDLAEPLSRLDIATGAPVAPAAGATEAPAMAKLAEGLRYLGYTSREIERVKRELEASGPSAEANVEALLKRALKLLQ
jgi:holliday junction DNA helicase RuvA